MAGATDLDLMLRSLSPRRVPGEFVFCSFADAVYGDHAALEPIASCREDEGLTLVIPKSQADAHQLEYQAVFACISLSVHSDLEAVGLTAAFASKLGEHGISANVLAGYYHDHIFVQQHLAQQAISALDELTRQADNPV